MAKVQINYKSGRSIEIVTENFTATRRGGVLAEVSWDSISGTIPLYFGVDSVESIWQVPEE